MRTPIEYSTSGVAERMGARRLSKASLGKVNCLRVTSRGVVVGSYRETAAGAFRFEAATKRRFRSPHQAVRFVLKHWGGR